MQAMLVHILFMELRSHMQHCCCCLVSAMSNTLQVHRLHYTRLPYASPSFGTCSNSSPLSQWCNPTISSSVVPFSCLQSFPAPGSQSNESVPHISWPKYWSFSFSISLSNEYSGLISFRMDWLDLLAVQETQELSPTPQFKASILPQSAFFVVQLSHHTWLLEKP